MSEKNKKEKGNNFEKIGKNILEKIKKRSFFIKRSYLKTRKFIIRVQPELLIISLILSISGLFFYSENIINKTENNYFNSDDPIQKKYGKLLCTKTFTDIYNEKFSISSFDIYENETFIRIQGDTRYDVIYIDYRFNNKRIYDSLCHFETNVGYLRNCEENYLKSIEKEIIDFIQSNKNKIVC